MRTPSANSYAPRRKRSPAPRRFRDHGHIRTLYDLAVGNLRDTGHSAEPTPPTAKADHQPYAFVHSAKADYWTLRCMASKASPTSIDEIVPVPRVGAPSFPRNDGTGGVLHVFRECGAGRLRDVRKSYVKSLPGFADRHHLPDGLRPARQAFSAGKCDGQRAGNQVPDGCRPAGVLFYLAVQRLRQIVGSKNDFIVRRAAARMLSNQQFADLALAANPAWHEGNSDL